MSSTDPSSDQPWETPEPILGEESISQPSPDLRRTPPAECGLAAPPGWRPEIDALPSVIARRPKPPHPNLGFAILWTILFIVVSQGAGVAAGVAFILLQIAIHAPDLDAYLNKLSDPAFLSSAEFAPVLIATFFVAEVVSIALGWLVLRLVAGREWMRHVALCRPGLAHFLFALLLFPAVVLVGEGVGELAKQLPLPHLVELEEFMKQVGNWPWWLAVLIIGFGPGIGEELYFRGFLGRGLVGHYGLVWGMVWTSLLFGIMHLEPLQVIYAPVIGMVLHYVYWTTRSLWLPMLLHMLNNSLGVLGASRNAPGRWVFEQLDESTKQVNHPAFIYGGAIILLVTVGYALYQSRARLEADSPEGVSWRPAYPGVEYPPAGIGTRVVHPVPSLAAFASAIGGFLFFVLACLAAAQVP